MPKDWITDLLFIKSELENFGEKVIWYACTYVEQITRTLTLTLTFEGFETLIFVRKPNPK